LVAILSFVCIANKIHKILIHFCTITSLYKNGHQNKIQSNKPKICFTREPKICLKRSEFPIENRRDIYNPDGY